MRKALAILLSLGILAICAACSAPEQGDMPPVGSAPTSALSQSGQEQFTDRDHDSSYTSAVEITLADSGISAASAGVSIDGSTVTITQEGTYRLTGKLSNGQIRVSVGDTEKVQLVLGGVSVNCESSAALYILSGDKVFVTAQTGTENALATSGEFVQTDDNTVDAAIFSKSDIVFNGEGMLAVISKTGHGIVSKDDLKITGGTYAVEAAGQGVTGKDSIRIAGGDLTVDSGTDGLHSKNDEDPAKGYIYIAGGTIRLTAGNDGMDATGEVYICGGDITAKTGDGSASVTHSDSNWGGGMGGWGGNGASSSSAESCKGIKAGTSLIIEGGSFAIDSEDDALHSNGDLAVSNGVLTLASGDDGVHAEKALVISGGQMDITKSYEGLEGTYITVSGGEITLVASDDGINAAGGNDGSGMAGPWGQGGGFGEATDAYITITGGKLTLNAGGDGIDSNGDLTVTGGEIYVDGPTNNGNGALDYAGTAKITGGTFIAIGASGMAMNFGNASTQGAILCSLNGSAPAGTEIYIEDSNGNVLARHTAAKSFGSILISAPGMLLGKTYTVHVGEATGEFTLDSLILGTGSGMGGPGGGPGGPGGGRPGRG